MIIYKNLNIKKKHKNSVVAIGNFDGLHIGHQKVLKEAKKKAKLENLKFGLITFEPVPTMFFNKNIKNHRINSLNQKIHYLKKIKLDFLIIIKFNKIFSNLSSENFIKSILFENLRSKYIFISQNFKFGKKRLGDVETLIKFEKKYLYKTIVTEPHKKKKQNNIVLFNKKDYPQRKSKRSRKIIRQTLVCRGGSDKRPTKRQKNWLSHM